MAAPDASRRVYARRMNRVLDHIDAHLDAPLDLPALAALAHFSAFHFHRLFAAWMGETLGAYLQRRRLETAAQRLIQRPRDAVLAVGLGVGFGSGEAFARAFKQRFGCTPSAWRAAAPQRHAAYLDEQREPLRRVRNLDQDGAAVVADDGRQHHPACESIMHVEIKTFPAERVAYLRLIGPYGPAIARFWQERVGPWLATEGFTGRPSYGIAHDDPSITPPSQCRYDAAVAVGPDYRASGETCIAELPGGRYAVARFLGRADEIGAAWADLFRAWLPASGYRCDDRPCFEYYGDPDCFDTASGRFSCEICIPVERL